MPMRAAVVLGENIGQKGLAAAFNEFVDPSTISLSSDNLRQMRGGLLSRGSSLSFEDVLPEAVVSESQPFAGDSPEGFCAFDLRHGGRGASSPGGAAALSRPGGAIGSPGGPAAKPGGPKPGGGASAGFCSVGDGTASANESASDNFTIILFEPFFAPGCNTVESLANGASPGGAETEVLIERFACKCIFRIFGVGSVRVEQ